MNVYRERIEKLRKLMNDENIGLYFIPMDDCHGSEYVSDHFRCIEFISGFTGSAGQLIVTADGAWLYADGRYYVQAEKQLEGSEIELMRLAAAGVPDPDEFIASKMKETAGAFGFDGNVVNLKQAENFIKKIKKVTGRKDLEVKDDRDLASEVWTDRPAQEHSRIWKFDEKFSGESVESKIKRIREKLSQECFEDDYLYVISSLDDIAWIFNIRANDIPENPVAFAYAAITPETVELFVKAECLDAELKKEFEKINVKISEYAPGCLCRIKTNAPVLMDYSCTTFSVYNYFKKNNNEIINIKNPSALMKALKNDTELKHAKNAMLRDSAVVTEFMYQLKKKAGEAGDGNLLKNDDGSIMSEISVDEYLTSKRATDPEYIELSFPTIAAYKENGAMMHYQAKPDNFKELRAEGMLLVDSGGQFNDGTTDITRTFILGPISEEEKKAFTLTAVSMLKLLNTKFIYGCTGENLDVMAREVMWREGWDYKCGTGHGVGHVLNVHEGPHCMRWSMKSGAPTAVLQEGMVVTDEPGVYREGKFGIRTENELVVTPFTETDDGKFLGFETITFIPIDLDGIDKKYMSEEDVDNLNRYHKEVFEKISPFLNEDATVWLKEYTKEI